MKQFIKYFFAALLAVIVSGGALLLIFFGFLGMFTKSLTSTFSSENKEVVDKLDGAKEILMVDLSKPYNEISDIYYMNLFFNNGNVNSIGLLDLLAAIKKAKTDDKIKGIYLKGNASANGLATLEQIRDAVEDFKSSGKFVVAYSEAYGQTDYYVSSVADSVYIHPMGGVEIKGLATTLTFFKGALDKLEVKPEIFYCGQFKSATEPFRFEKMTDPNRQQLAAMQSDVWKEFVKAFAEKSQKSEAEIQQLANTYAVRTPQDAMDRQLVNGIKYKDEVEAVLKSLTQKSDDEKVPVVSVNDYWNSQSASTHKDEIAILVAEGNIVDGRKTGSEPTIASETFIEEIRKIKDNDKIKAVVLRVNSGGGSALASENILRELNLLREQKPYVVTMGDYAASGGYYIAAKADSIYAMPNTITGSIGVFGMMFNFENLMKNKLGITTDTEKNAPYADFPTFGRDFSAEERNIIQSGVDTIYALFKRRVAEGRNMSVASVDSIGQGRIWTGTQALKLGLVDAIGGVDRAVKGVAAIANLNNYKVVTYPKQENQFALLLKMMNPTSIQEKLTDDMALHATWGEAYSFYKMLISYPKNNGIQYYMMMPYKMQIH